MADSTMTIRPTYDDVIVEAVAAGTTVYRVGRVALVRTSRGAAFVVDESGEMTAPA